jgi:hypothetical protein
MTFNAWDKSYSQDQSVHACTRNTATPKHAVTSYKPADNLIFSFISLNNLYYNNVSLHACDYVSEYSPIALRIWLDE